MFQSHKDLVGAVKGFITIVKDPQKTDAVFEIAKGMESSHLPRRLADRQRAASPEVARLLDDRYMPPVADLEALGQLPAGTLGRVFADHMKKNGFDVVFYPPVAVKDDGSYLMQRLRQTHDIWHTVTGFGTDPIGEVGLQAFMLAQLKSPFSAVLIASGLVSTLLKPRERREVLAEVRRGYRMGKAARPVLGARFEDGWDWPLSEWRVKLGLAQAAA